MNTPRCLQSGFTLIELLMVVAVIAVAMTVAVPSMTSFVRNAELTSTTNTMLASINTARSEAMKRGMNAMVKPVDTSNWALGWVVFVDVARNGNATDTTNIVVSKQDALPSYFSITITGFSAVGFDASGFAKTVSPSSQPNGNFSIWRNDLSGTNRTTETRKIFVDVTGRVRTCKPATDSNC